MDDVDSFCSDADTDHELLLRPLIKYEPRPKDGANLALELRAAFRRHDKKVILVDTANKVEWTGGELLERASRIATGLVKQLGVRPNDVIMTICNHTDMEILLALGIIFSGASLYGTQPVDGYAEAKVLCELVKPNVFVVQSELHDRVVALRHNVPGISDAKIVWLDNPIAGLVPIRQNSINVNGHKNGYNEAISIMAANIKNLSDLSLDEINTNNDNYSYDDDCNKITQTNGYTDIDRNNNIDNDQVVHNFKLETEKMLEKKKLIDTGKVVLFDELINGSLDEHLIEAIARDAIKPSEHVATYMLTSGSTGRPKIVPSTHDELVHGLYSMIAACVNPVQERAGVRRGSIIYMKSCTKRYTKQNYANQNGSTNIRYKTPLMPHGQNEIVSGDLPLDHGAGLNTMFLSLWLGAKYIVMPSYDVDAFWDAVSQYKITFSISSTSFCYKLFSRLKALIDSGDTSRWQLDSFKYIACTGAKIAFFDLVQEVTKVYPQIKVAQFYGCTEIGFMALVHPDECKTYAHSVGYLAPGLVAKIVDRDKSTDKPLGPEERGELLVRAKSKFKGYKCHWRDDPARIFAECHDSTGMFYRTGDMAHYDHDGRLYIHGRFKDTLVLMEDWKILPAELEEVVQEHPLVKMCAVVGVPDPLLPGCHAPKAFVKLISTDPADSKQLNHIDKLLLARWQANDTEFICKNIYDFVAERTARPKHLTGGVRILDEFPRVGLLNKIDRKVLMQMD